MEGLADVAAAIARLEKGGGDSNKATRPQSQMPAPQAPPLVSASSGASGSLSHASSANDHSHSSFGWGHGRYSDAQGHRHHGMHHGMYGGNARQQQQQQQQQQQPVNHIQQHQQLSPNGNGLSAHFPSRDQMQHAAAAHAAAAAARHQDLMMQQQQQQQQLQYHSSLSNHANFVDAPHRFRHHHDARGGGNVNGSSGSSANTRAPARSSPTPSTASASTGARPVGKSSPTPDAAPPSQTASSPEAAAAAAPQLDEESAADLALLNSSQPLKIPPAPPADEIIPTPLDADVISGRGGESNHHPGNIFYRHLVKKYQPLYIRSKRRDKPRISQLIVARVRQRGARFLKKDPNSTGWRDIGNNKAREKTSQALREGAPELRGTSVGNRSASPSSSAGHSIGGANLGAEPMAGGTMSDASLVSPSPGVGRHKLDAAKLLPQNDQATAAAMLLNHARMMPTLDYGNGNRLTPVEMATAVLANAMGQHRPGQETSMPMPRQNPSSVPMPQQNPSSMPMLRPQGQGRGHGFLGRQQHQLDRPQHVSSYAASSMASLSSPRSPPRPHSNPSVPIPAMPRSSSDSLQRTTSVPALTSSNSVAVVPSIISTDDDSSSSYEAPASLVRKAPAPASRGPRLKRLKLRIEGYC